MDLVGRNQRSPKQRQSYVRELTSLRRSCRPVFALHHAVIGGRRAECDAVPLIIRSHPGKRAASRNSAFEVIDVRGFEIRTRRLIVVAVLIQPRNWVRIHATVRSQYLFLWACIRSQRMSPSHSGRADGL